MTGSAAFLNGAFAEAAGSVSGINAPFGGFVFLDKVSGSLRVQPDFAFSGGIGLTAGPRIPVLDAAAAALDGTFSFQQGPPDTYALGGDLKLAEVSLANANASYRTDGLFNFNGSLSFSKAGFGLETDLSGFVSGGGFNAEGSGKIKTPGPDVDGKGLISDRGIAGCGSVGAWVLKVEAGFGYHWGDFAPTRLPAATSAPTARRRRRGARRRRSVRERPHRCAYGRGCASRRSRWPAPTRPRR